MPRIRETIPLDDYVLDVLLRDMIGHDGKPAAYLVYLYLYGQATRAKWKSVERVSACSRKRPASPKARCKLR